MSIIQEMLSKVPLPRMVKIRQEFACSAIGDIESTVTTELGKPGVAELILPGKRLAITVGSRGIADIDKIALAIVNELKRRGALPFIVPAMGSHGGSTAEGQKEVIAALGVTEERMGCPIVSSMEVVELGRLANGLTVLMDKNAFESDGIIVLNRIKPHTAFRGPCESGLVKMITIGLGKQKGADSCHAYGFGHMATHILEMTEISLAKAPILFGVAIVENAYDRVACIEAMPASEIVAADQRLLVTAKGNMPRIPFEYMDILIVDRIGKEFSGDGMDPNITGRYSTPFATGGPTVNKIVVFDLTEETHGNANGIGIADFTTRRLVNNINFDYSYANAFTSTITVPVRLPVIMESDRDAIMGAVKTCNAKELANARVVRIRDTLHLSEMWVSEAMIPEAAKQANITVLGEAAEMRFSSAGDRLD